MKKTVVTLLLVAALGACADPEDVSAEGTVSLRYDTAAWVETYYVNGACLVHTTTRVGSTTTQTCTLYQQLPVTNHHPAALWLQLRNPEPRRPWYCPWCSERVVDVYRDRAVSRELWESVAVGDRVTVLNRHLAPH